MAEYELTASAGMILHVPTGTWIPDNPDNRHWVEFQAWLAAGNTPDPYVAPPAPIPQSVSRMQAMVALSRAGLLTAVQTWVASQDAETQLIWNNAPEFSRGSTMLIGAAAALGLNSDQVDALFAAAAAINP